MLRLVELLSLGAFLAATTSAIAAPTDSMRHPAPVVPSGKTYAFFEKGKLVAQLSGGAKTGKPHLNCVHTKCP